MTSEIKLPAVEEIENNKISPAKEKVVVCRGRSCRKYKAERVWQNFEQNLPPDVELMSVPCLGQCGNGSMVVIDADKTWYSQVHPDEVDIIIKQHIIGKSPVEAMLYPKFHKGG